MIELVNALVDAGERCESGEEPSHVAIRDDSAFTNAEQRMHAVYV